MKPARPDPRCFLLAAEILFEDGCEYACNALHKASAFLNRDKFRAAEYFRDTFEADALSLGFAATVFFSVNPYRNPPAGFAIGDARDHRIAALLLCYVMLTHEAERLKRARKRRRHLAAVRLGSGLHHGPSRNQGRDD